MGFQKLQKPMDYIPSAKAKSVHLLIFNSIGNFGACFWLKEFFHQKAYPGVQ